MPELTPDEIAAHLSLTPLPIEGGRLGQTWEDETSSAIVFLMTANDCSGLHVLPSPEIWFFHGGSPAKMLLLHPDGRIEEPILGLDLAGGHRPQVAVAPGVYMAAEPMGEWSLLGTYMSPPYEESTVVFPTADEMVPRYPDAAARITRLARF